MGGGGRRLGGCGWAGVICRLRVAIVVEALVIGGLGWDVGGWGEEKYLTGNDKKRFEGDIDAMNTILLGIPNDIYNSVDACKTAKAMWTHVRRLMQGTNLRDVTSDDQTNILTTKMMLLAHAITQHYSTPINNHLRTSSNIRNQAYVQDGRVDVQSKNVGNVGTSGQNSKRVDGNQGNTVGNVYVQRTAGNGTNVQRTPRTSANSRNTPKIQCYNYNRKDAAEEEEFEELNAICITLVRIQSVVNDSDVDSDFINEVHSYVEGTSETVEYDINAHDQHLVEMESLMRSVKLEA
ncbi:hypothetical protein Tco_0629677 [Tanacetum coccineum]|uniref:Uncharacterized protein n=1 Tax=Tanacetum coccineum TaxID=301880 RepID=A0ABQ4WTV7_9ASTR